MALETRLIWGGAVNVTVTNLHSMSAGDIWRSGKLDMPSGSQTVAPLVVVTFKIALASWVVNDYCNILISRGDEEATTEIWPGNLQSEAEGRITNATEKANARQGLIPSATPIVGSTSQTFLTGDFGFHNPSPDFQILVDSPSKAIAASGSLIHYRVVQPQQQS